MLTVLLGVLGTAFSGYVLICLLGYVVQERFVFQTRPRLDRDPGLFGWEFKEVLLPVNGELTHGWFIPLEGARGALLFSHGNAGNIADRLESISLLRDLGFSVLAYDYGGYGRSTGRPSEKRCYADIEAMWRYLLEAESIPEKKIVLFGRSLGGGATAHLAAHTLPAAVVLESTFLSLPEAAQDAYPLFPCGLILRHRFPNRENVKSIRVPLLVVHSRGDRVVLFRHGEGLFRAGNEPKRFLEISGPHRNGFVLSKERYFEGWEAFLAPILPREKSSSSSSGEGGAEKSEVL